MAGKVLPGSKYDTGSNSSGTQEREFSTAEKGTGIESGHDPYDSAANGSVAVRDSLAARLTDSTDIVEDGKEPVEKQPEKVITAPVRQQTHTPEKTAVTWEAELNRQGGDIRKAYELHLANTVKKFKEDLILRTEETARQLKEQEEAAFVIERERKNTIDYAMAAYGSDANLQGISDRAVKSQQKNAKEMVGPLAGLSFQINQKLSDKKQTLVMMPNGRQVEMDAGVAAVLNMTEKNKGDTMASLFKDYVQETDPGFAAAVNQAGGFQALAKNSQLQFDRGQTNKISRLWGGVVEKQMDEIAFEAKPTDKLTPKEYEALGLDPTQARERRLRQYGDPTSGLDIQYSHEFEYNGRRLPQPLIMGSGSSPSKSLDEITY